MFNYFNRNAMRYFCVFLIISASSLSLSAEESPSEEVHILSTVEYNSDNKTRESALQREMAIPDSKSFASREELETYMADKAQDLINLRVLDDVQWKVELTGQDEEASYYKGIIEVKSSWTIYPIPYPKYDSNTGFRIGMKIYYDNFLGTLTNFYLGTNMDIRNDDGEWVIPQWSFNPKIKHVKFFNQIFSIGVMQQFLEETKYSGDEYVQNYTYFQTAVDMSTSILLPHNFSYSLSPGFTFYYGYKDQLENNGSNIEKSDMEFAFSHGLSYSDLDWVGNFRKGFAMGVSNSISLVTENSIEADEDALTESELSSGEFRTSMSGDIKGFYPWWRFNPSARLSGFYVFNDEESGKGETLRGVFNDSMFGNRGVFLNTSLNISVIPWTGVGEALFQPFFDIGFTGKEDEALDWDEDLKYGAGADFILYLDKLKSLVARGSIGVDLTIPDWNDSRKIEIEITSSLAY